MTQMEFGEAEARPIRTVLADLVYDHMAAGASEDAAISAVRDEIFAAIQDGTPEPWMEVATLAALREFVRTACRDRERRNGPTVIVGGKRGKVRSVYAVPAVAPALDGDAAATPTVQMRLAIMAMTFPESRLALANQERLAANLSVRIDRLRLLIDRLEAHAGDAETLGEAAERLGCTRELIDLSDVLSV
jgi:hypothetical protein